MRILIRTSKWAVWARRFGALAFPLALIPVVLHRSHLVTSDNFVVMELVAMSLAAAAVIAALVAFTRLWYTGDQGWSKATLAFLFGIVCLLPGAWFGWEALRTPSSSDITTDFTNPPALVSFVEARFIGPQERQRLEAAYPNARSRTYPIEGPQMFELVESMVERSGWDIRARRMPVGALDTGQVNAIVTTLLGFKHEVAVRVAGTAEGATIAMRSASLTAWPDLGENGERIETFLLDLDNQVTLLLRNASTQSPDAESD